MSTELSFTDLGLPSNILTTLTDLGYETPTPIQSQSIPILLEKHDISAQAQTGTGKTAAFALPILANLDLSIKKPQALIIAPTRELAIQVAEAFQSYAKKLKGFQVTPIYGGQDYQIQLRALKCGSHVIVGTPGRVMDHLRRETISVNSFKTVVLDEADEMLKMGFIDDIEWILQQIPQEHQTALFSATMPASIQKVAKKYLNEPKKIHIKPKKTTVDTIEQFYTRVNKVQKLDVLTRFLEVEELQAAIIFSRTKTGSAELAEKLQARGYAAAALNGDMSQSMREKVIGRIKNSSLDIIVATDVAARGIDVERVSHVINYDIPYDVESYIHRIGRTGRAGRQGKALLFVTPREFHLLRDIEDAVRSPIKQIEPPSVKQLSEKRSQQLAEKVVGIIAKSKKLKPYQDMVNTIQSEHDCSPTDIAAALAYLMQQANPLPSNELSPAEEEPTKKRGRRRPGDKGSMGRPGGRAGGRPGNKKKRASNAGNSKDDGAKRRTSENRKPSEKRKGKPSKPGSSQTGRPKRKER